MTDHPLEALDGQTVRLVEFVEDEDHNPAGVDITTATVVVVPATHEDESTDD